MNVENSIGVSNYQNQPLPKQESHDASIAVQLFTKMTPNSVEENLWRLLKIVDRANESTNEYQRNLTLHAMSVALVKNGNLDIAMEVRSSIHEEFQNAATLMDIFMVVTNNIVEKDYQYQPLNEQGLGALPREIFVCALFCLNDLGIQHACLVNRRWREASIDAGKHKKISILKDSVKLLGENFAQLDTGSPILNAINLRFI